ncbi:MAG: ROK family protein [Acidobacteriota bacterium]
MPLAIGVLAAENIVAGLVENDQLVGSIHTYPEASHRRDIFEGLPTEDIVQKIFEQIEAVRGGQEIAAVGLGFPGFIQNDVVQECPNIPQVKGYNICALLTAALRDAKLNTKVSLLNDADAIAAGIAVEQGEVGKLIRIWFLGNGVGCGHYPLIGEVMEEGHMVVTLDPKENFCGCGGIGHLEGIMGYRAMRLRFLDLEPEEVFAEAQQGDERCVEFVKLWHRALAAATASSIHMYGAGKFYISGPNAKFVSVNLLQEYLYEMVKMSSLQGSSFETVSTTEEIAIIGAAHSALLANGQV